MLTRWRRMLIAVPVTCYYYSEYNPYLNDRELIMGIENPDGKEIKNVILAITTARTGWGRRLKMITFFVSFIISLLIPLGVIVIYFLWKHGNNILNNNGASIRLNYGISAGEE